MHCSTLDMLHNLHKAGHVGTRLKMHRACSGAFLKPETSFNVRLGTAESLNHLPAVAAWLHAVLVRHARLTSRATIAGRHGTRWCLLLLSAPFHVVSTV